MSSNCLVFHISGEISSSPEAFLFLIFLSTESSSSRVNGPRLMSNCLLIILVIGLCVTFAWFPSRFSKCCFHSFILSCWFVAFSLALVVLSLRSKKKTKKKKRFVNADFWVRLALSIYLSIMDRMTQGQFFVRWFSCARIHGQVVWSLSAFSLERLFKHQAMSPIRQGDNDDWEDRLLKRSSLISHPEPDFAASSQVSSPHKV